MNIISMIARGSLVSLALLCNQALAAPPIHWDPAELKTSVHQGESKNVTIKFYALQDIGEVRLRLTPEIANLASLNSQSISNIKAGDTVEIQLTLAAQIDDPIAIVDGTLQLWPQTKASKKNGLIARPLPILIMVEEAEGIAGQDADMNGVWDYVDEYINTTFADDFNSTLRKGLRQYARAFQSGLLDAGVTDKALRAAQATDRGAECIFSQLDESAVKVILKLEAEILNTDARSIAYFLYSEQSAGHFFQQAKLSEFSVSCINDEQL